jgi:hypothetical protein
MEPLTATLAIIAVFIVLALWLARTDGLAFLAPKSTRVLQASAQAFCVRQCRVNGQCPLTHTTERASDCPLFGFVAADVPTVMYGSPFDAIG